MGVFGSRKGHKMARPLMPIPRACTRIEADRAGAGSLVRHGTGLDQRESHQWKDGPKPPKYVVAARHTTTNQSAAVTNLFMWTFPPEAAHACFLGSAKMQRVSRHSSKADWLG